VSDHANAVRDRSVRRFSTTDGTAKLVPAIPLRNPP
jgi:hypothetical protein